MFGRICFLFLVLSSISSVSSVWSEEKYYLVLFGGVAYGVEASAMVANHLRPYTIRPEVSHAHLLPRLGLDKHTVTCRGFDR